MANVEAPQQSAERGDSARLMAIVAYALFLAGWPSFHVTTVIALVLAYVQRGESRGTIWESHFTNIIHTFWISLIVGIVAIPLCFVLVGFGVLAVLAGWFLYRTIKGLIRALDDVPYV
jgi:uncharacterized membrane protein